MISRFLIPALAFLVAACAPAPKKSKVQYLQTPPADFQLVDGVAGPNDIARFLAGKPVRNGAVLSRLQQTVEYQQHHAEMRQVWLQMAKSRVGKMKAWSAANVPPARIVHYPFGGPDLLHAMAMFPDAPAYILMGLEGVGEVPPLESLPPEEVLGALPAYRQATKTQLQVGYFITKDMRSDLENSALRGVTPILLGTIGMINGEVASVSSSSVGGMPAVEIAFRDPVGGGHRAAFISGDLSNKGFNQPCQQWLAAQGRGTTYFKAASYLMHDDRFSNARNFFLTNSASIVQDDSGIPYRFFDSSIWNIRYFGRYDQPIELFSKHAQADLRAAYSASGAASLSFGSGYQYDPANANLIVATKR